MTAPSFQIIRLRKRLLESVSLSSNSQICVKIMDALSGYPGGRSLVVKP